MLSIVHIFQISNILFSHLFSPPVWELDQSSREVFPKWREGVSHGARSLCSDTSLENSDRCEFFETIGEDLAIHIAYCFANRLETMVSLIHGLHDKNNPFLSKKSEKFLSFWACTLRLFCHKIRWQNYYFIAEKYSQFLSKSKYLLLEKIFIVLFHFII